MRILNLAAVLVVAMLLAAAPGQPSTVSAVGPVPECRIDDIYTVPRGYDDWSVTLVDWLLRVEDDYVPPDLVPVTEAGLVGAGFIRAVAVEDTRAMAEAAAANGTPIAVWSGYRAYDEQVQIFNGYANQFGYEDAITYSARPGHSEHQLGLGVDFMSLGGGNPLPGDWATTPAGAWMRDNSWKYGWINSYPLGPPEDPLWNPGACFHYEPWHYRYLGREIAAAVHESGLTIREYLWTHYTTVDPVTGQPLATATPTPSPSPTPTPTPSPRPSPTPSLSPVPTPSPAPPSPTHDETTSDDAGDAGVALPVTVALGVAGLIALVGLVYTRRSR